jgi:hypothetical protein
VWDTVLPHTRDPWAIQDRFEDDFAHRADLVYKYRHCNAFHPVHGILATHPLKRLRHAARVYVAGAQDPEVPRHVGFIPTRTVEEAIAEAERIHGAGCTIACVRTPQGV